MKARFVYECGNIVGVLPSMQADAMFANMSTGAFNLADLYSSINQDTLAGKRVCVKSEHVDNVFIFSALLASQELPVGRECCSQIFVVNS